MDLNSRKDGFVVYTIYLFIISFQKAPPQLLMGKTDINPLGFP